MDLPTGRVYTDQTGAFPIVSSRGVKAVMVLYDYDSNAILTEGITSRGQSELLRAYKVLHERLVAAGHKPQFQRLDNEASGVFKRFLTMHDIDYQLTPAGMHRRNAAERAVRTWKNHFLAGLASINPRFPLRFWCQLLPQAEITLNLLRQSRINPKLSAYAQLFGQFDFNRTPLAPPGCEAIIFNTPDQRKSWDFHGEKGWYVGPAMEHYRCFLTVNPNTGRQRVAETLQFLPHNFDMPKTSSLDVITRAASDLASALAKPAPALPFLQPNQQLTADLHRLSDIFQKAATQPPPPVETAPRQPPTMPMTAPPHEAPPMPILPPIVSPPRPPRVARALAVEQLPTITGAPRVPNPKLAGKIPIQNTNPATAQDMAIAPLPTPMHQLAMGVFDEELGRTLEYRQLIRHPKHKQVWLRSSANEFGRLAQGVGDRIKGTDTIRFIPKHKVPKGRSVTYGRFVCEIRPQKEETHRTRLTVGGNLVDYPGQTYTPTADITTFKIQVNDILSTPNAKAVMCRHR